jgi:hypothetical protein
MRLQIHNYKRSLTVLILTNGHIITHIRDRKASLAISAGVVFDVRCMAVP